MTSRETQPVSDGKNASAITDEKAADAGVWSRLSLHEFLVDFFGGLVPGVLFTVMLAASLLPAFDALSAALHGGGREPSPWTLAEVFIKATSDTPGMIWIALFTFVLMVGYVLGHLFLRKDPKIPDVRSFQRLKREAERLHDESVDDDWLQKNFACASDEECQFPYKHMNKYLRARGHDHLAQIADEWCQDSRSKTYINRLKLRLAFWNPSKYRPVVRNEAHVRLVTSTWYMGQALSKVAGFVSGPLLVVAAFVKAQMTGMSGYLAFVWVFDSAIPTLLAVGAGLYSSRACESFLHYQRLREVYAVLELAHTAHYGSPILEPTAISQPTVQSEPPPVSSENVVASRISSSSVKGARG